MQWKEDAIDAFAPDAFELLISAVGADYSEVILVCEHGPGVVAVSAIYYTRAGAKKGVENFFDVADALKEKAAAFHAEFARHGENFQSAKLVLNSDENLDIEFDYESMNKWDLVDRAQFPIQLCV